MVGGPAAFRLLLFVVSTSSGPHHFPGCSSWKHIHPRHHLRLTGQIGSTIIVLFLIVSVGSFVLLLPLFPARESFYRCRTYLPDPFYMYKVIADGWSCGSMGVEPLVLGSVCYCRHHLLPPSPPRLFQLGEPSLGPGSMASSSPFVCWS